jgi:hypothetical protein
MYNFSTLSAVQKLKLHSVIDKYNCIKGSYEDTMLAGIVHGYCDSGILTDAFSVNDAKVINKYVDEDTQYNSDLFELNEIVKQHTNKDLQCVSAINDISKIESDVELAVAYIGSRLNILMEHCYTN